MIIIYCPVCGNKLEHLSQCPTCGYDGTKDYELYPTLSLINDNKKSVSLRRMEYNTQVSDLGEKAVDEKDRRVIYAIDDPVEDMHVNSTCDPSTAENNVETNDYKSDYESSVEKSGNDNKSDIKKSSKLRNCCLAAAVLGILLIGFIRPGIDKTNNAGNNSRYSNSVADVEKKVAGENTDAPDPETNQEKHSSSEISEKNTTTGVMTTPSQMIQGLFDDNQECSALHMNIRYDEYLEFLEALGYNDKTSHTNLSLQREPRFRYYSIEYWYDEGDGFLMMSHDAKTGRLHKIWCGEVSDYEKVKELFIAHLQFLGFSKNEIEYIIGEKTDVEHTRMEAGGYDLSFDYDKEEQSFGFVIDPINMDPSELAEPDTKLIELIANTFSDTDVRLLYDSFDINLDDFVCFIREMTGFDDGDTSLEIEAVQSNTAGKWFNGSYRIDDDGEEYHILFDVQSERIQYISYFGEDVEYDHFQNNVTYILNFLGVDEEAMTPLWEAGGETSDEGITVGEYRIVLTHDSSSYGMQVHKEYTK